MAGARLQEQYGQSELDCILCTTLRFFKIYGFEIVEGREREMQSKEGAGNRKQFQISFIKTKLWFPSCIRHDKNKCGLKQLKKSDLNSEVQWKYL